MIYCGISYLFILLYSMKALLWNGHGCVCSSLRRFRGKFTMQSFSLKGHEMSHAQDSILGFTKNTGLKFFTWGYQCLVWSDLAILYSIAFSIFTVSFLSFFHFRTQQWPRNPKVIPNLHILKLLIGVFSIIPCIFSKGCNLNETLTLKPLFPVDKKRTLIFTRLYTYRTTTENIVS